jgi:hypothetical protein
MFQKERKEGKINKRNPPQPPGRPSRGPPGPLGAGAPLPQTLADVPPAAAAAPSWDPPVSAPVAPVHLPLPHDAPLSLPPLPRRPLFFPSPGLRVVRPWHGGPARSPPRLGPSLPEAASAFPPRAAARPARSAFPSPRGVPAPVRPGAALAPGVWHGRGSGVGVLPRPGAVPARARGLGGPARPRRASRASRSCPMSPACGPGSATRRGGPARHRRDGPMANLPCARPDGSPSARAQPRHGSVGARPRRGGVARFGPARRRAAQPRPPRLVLLGCALWPRAPPCAQRGLCAHDSPRSGHGITRGALARPASARLLAPLHVARDQFVGEMGCGHVRSPSYRIVNEYVFNVYA